jgi:hypothetical protein
MSWHAEQMAHKPESAAHGADKRKGLHPAMQAALWTVSNGRCYAPGCPIPVVLEVRPGVYQKNSQIAHIYGVRPKAARYRGELSEERRDSFENLVILCLAHHEEVDSDEDRYPPEKLHEWKLHHEGDQNSVLKSLRIGNPETVLTALAKIAEPPLKRLEAITKRLEETGTANADTVKELKQIIASISDSSAGIDAQTARSLAHAAEVLGTRDFILSARRLSEAAETLPGISRQIAETAERMMRGDR